MLANIVADLMWTLTRYDIPHTLLEFPRLAREPEHAQAKLGFLDPTLTVDVFKVAFEKRYDADEIRQEPLSRKERLIALALQPWTFVRRVAKRVERWFTCGNGS